jgi:hypothetical protein
VCVCEKIGKSQSSIKSCCRKEQLHLGLETKKRHIKRKTKTKSSKLQHLCGMLFSDKLQSNEKKRYLVVITNIHLP